MSKLIHPLGRVQDKICKIQACLLLFCFSSCRKSKMDEFSEAWATHLTI